MITAADALSRASPMPRPAPDAYCPCPGCGVPVLTGETRDGTPVCVDPAQRTYVAIWEPEPKPKGKAPHYVLVPSMAYPVHVCAQPVSLGERNVLSH